MNSLEATTNFEVAWALGAYSVKSWTDLDVEYHRLLEY